MRYKTLFTLLSIQLFAYRSYAQIKLPVGFKCKFEEGQIYGRDQFTTDGKYNFNWMSMMMDISTNTGGEGTPEDELKAGLKICFDDSAYSKTNDSLYIGTGKWSNNEYYYTIYIPEKQSRFSITSQLNNEKFSKYSVWLLQEVRKKRKSSSLIFITANGQTCLDPDHPKR